MYSGDLTLLTTISNISLVGAPLAGRLSDRVVIAWRKRRGGVWVPEDRLRATLWGAAVLVPMSILLSGLTTQFVPGTLGIGLNLVWLFMNGVGVCHIVMICGCKLTRVVCAGGRRAVAVVGILRGYLALAECSNDSCERVKPIISCSGFEDK